MRSLAAGCVAMVTVSCAGSAAPVDLRAPVDLSPHPPVEIRLVLPPELARDSERYLRAASSALRGCVNALGGFDRPDITLTMPAWHGSPPPRPDAITLDRVPWWTTPTSMTQELAAARGVSRQCWAVAIDASRLPQGFVEGLAEFMARRAVLPIFEGDNTAPGYAFLEERYFAGFVPRFVRIRLLLESDGAPVSAYRVYAQTGSQSPLASLDASVLAGRALLAFGTLERWVGRPVFDEILMQFVRGSKGQAPRIADLERVASEVSGQQLSWFFDQAFRFAGTFDYGVEGLVSELGPDGAYVTTVIARRYGEALFTGARGPRTGAFDNGRGITLHVTFADHQQRTDWWDGRDERRTFRYRSPARAVSATIDPDRVLLLDLQQTNNSWTLAPKQSAAATRWATVYLQWVEHLLLSYASFV
jgi:hypothetical protein